MLLFGIYMTLLKSLPFKLCFYYFGSSLSLGYFGKWYVNLVSSKNQLLLDNKYFILNSILFIVAHILLFLVAYCFALAWSFFNIVKYIIKLIT